jgi:hypothetical protein
MKVRVIQTNKMPRWRYIKRYKDSDKVDEMYFSTLTEIADYLNEPKQNVAHFTSEKTDIKHAYRGTIKRWEGVEITRMKVKKIITYAVDEE